MTGRTDPDLHSFVEGYLGDELRKMEELYEAVVDSPECLIVTGTIEDPPSLDYLRDTVGFLTALLTQGGVAVYDPQRFAWWSAATWSEQIFEPSSAVPLHHCLILVSAEKDSEYLWIHTRGLRKFGRPDISVRHVPQESSNLVVQLCERFIEHQAFGLVVEEGQPIKMAGLPPGMACKHRGDLDDPDFNNVHIEIEF